MGVALLFLLILPCCIALALIHRRVTGPPWPLPISDGFHPNTGFPGLDVALEDYYTDPTATNEAEVVFQTEYAQGAVESCCFPE